MYKLCLFVFICKKPSIYNSVIPGYVQFTIDLFSIIYLFIVSDNKYGGTIMISLDSCKDIICTYILKENKLVQ